MKSEFFSGRKWKTTFVCLENSMFKLRLQTQVKKFTQHVVQWYKIDTRYCDFLIDRFVWAGVKPSSPRWAKLSAILFQLALYRKEKRGAVGV